MAGSRKRADHRVQPHREVPVHVTVWVDHGIVPLVRAINAYPGFTTIASCQGRFPHDPAFVELRTHDYTNWKHLGTFLFGLYDTLPLALRVHVAVELTPYEHFSPDCFIGKIQMTPRPSIIAAVSRHLLHMANARPKRVCEQ